VRVSMFFVCPRGALYTIWAFTRGDAHRREHAPPPSRRPAPSIPYIGAERAGTAPSGNEAHPLPAEREQEARNRPHINNESIKIICSNKILSYILHARLPQREKRASWTTCWSRRAANQPQQRATLANSEW
jgi:hypothetical protein